jgi:Na+:H+ antiporter, NhaA family
MASIIEKPVSILRDFLNSTASGGFLLVAAAAVALGWANSTAAGSYFAILNSKLGPMSVQHWINDGLMAFFFLLVGLEIKREFVDGHLTTWPDRRLPVLAAAGGMIIPALVYLALVGGETHLARGWAIPAATDIAFAIAVLMILGNRVPTSLKLLLTTIAIVDDMGAVVVIALAYTKAIGGIWLLAALAIMTTMFGLRRVRVFAMRWYFVGFVLLWFAVLQSGVHATVSGVLAAITIPVRITKAAPDAADSTLHRMEHALQKPVAWVIVPLFGLANAGVTFVRDGFFQTLPLAIGLGLFLGKQAGVFSSIWLAVRLGFAQRPVGASWMQIYGVSVLCGIGFTMSLFIGTLAFQRPQEIGAVKIGVLTGSLLSALVGWLVLSTARPVQRAPKQP